MEKCNLHMSSPLKPNMSIVYSSTLTTARHPPTPGATSLWQTCSRQDSSYTTRHGSPSSSPSNPLHPPQPLHLDHPGPRSPGGPYDPQSYNKVTHKTIRGVYRIHAMHLDSGRLRPSRVACRACLLWRWHQNYCMYESRGIVDDA